jgi:hypothetical protein
LSIDNFIKKLGVPDALGLTRIFALVCALVSGASLALGMMMLILTSLGFFMSTEVSLKDVQAELSKKNPPTGIETEIDGLRSQFAHLDNDRWSGARELISNWVEEWSNDPREQRLFIAEMKDVAQGFAPEQKSAAVDVFYRLKQEKLREATRRQQTSWLHQLGTFSAIFASLILFGIFSLVLTLIKIERNTRS